MSIIILQNEEYQINNNLIEKLNNVFLIICNEERLSDCSINLKIVNDQEMEDLNNRFRKKNSSL